MMQSMLAVSIGAVIGANLRWLLGLWLNLLFPAVPPGTLAANLLGAWLMGLLLAAFATLPEIAPLWRLFLVTGLLGALTTFSTFSAEVFANLQAGRVLTAMAAIAVHVAGSLLMVAAGVATFRLCRMVWCAL